MVLVIPDPLFGRSLYRIGVNTITANFVSTKDPGLFPTKLFTIFSKEILKNLCPYQPSMYIDELIRINCINMASKLSYDKYLKYSKQKLTRKV